MASERATLQKGWIKAHAKDVSAGGHGLGYFSQAIDYFVNGGAAPVHSAVGSQAIIEAQPEMLTKGAIRQEVTVSLDKTRHQDRIGKSIIPSELSSTQLRSHRLSSAHVQDAPVTNSNGIGTFIAFIQCD
jgi:hypothetical protein